MSDNSKIIAALLVGAAVGAAIGYFIAKENKEEAMDNIEGTITLIKDKLHDGIEKGRTIVNDLADKAEELLNTEEQTS
jgi:membrane protein DedA with SNARE-associated domain